MTYPRFIVVFLALIFFIGGAHIAQAQTTIDTASFTGPDAAAIDQIAQQNVANMQQQAQASIQQNLSNNGTLSGTPPTDAGNGTGGGKSPSDVFGPILGVIMSIFAWLLGVAGVLLNDVVYYTVVTMGKYVQNLGAVGVTWRVLRDIGNIILIFGFLAIGISTIIGYDNYGEKRLPMLLVVALLLNFSLLISEAIIDVGNIFATQFYTQISGGEIVDPSNPLTNASSEGGISNAIVQSLSLQTLENVAPQDGSGSSWLPSGQVIFVGILSIILFIVAAFVLFTLSFILIARFVVLLMLIIVAPVGFAGLLVPKLNSIANDWWETLIKNTISAPILLLLLYVALRVILDTGFLKGINASGANWSSTAAAAANSATGATGFAGIDLAFGIAMGLLLLCVIVANRLSLYGASAATKLAGAASFGAVSFGMSSTFGSAGNMLASKRMKSWARTNKLAAAGVFLGSGLRRSTYDMRNVPGVGSRLGSLGIDAGKGVGLTAGQVHDAQYGVKPIKEFLKEGRHENERVGRELDLKDAIAAGTDAEVQRLVAKTSNKELEELKAIKQGNEKLVKNLSPQQFEAMMKSDKLNDEEKQHIKDARYGGLRAALAQTLPNEVQDPSAKEKRIRETILDKYGKGEIESLPANFLEDETVLSAFTDKQREWLTDSNQRTSDEKDRVKKKSKVGKVITMFEDTSGSPGTGAVGAAKELARLTPQQVAKLPTKILKSAEIASAFTPAQLNAIQKEDKLNQEEISTIKNIILAGGTTGARDHVENALNAWYWS